MKIDYVPVEECAGDLQVVAWLRLLNRIQSESELNSECPYLQTRTRVI